MGKYKYSDFVKEKSLFFADILRQNGFCAEADDSSIRDYMIKINLERDDLNIGKLRLYYKPSKNLYTIDMTEIRESRWIEDIRLLWEGKIPGGRSGNEKINKNESESLIEAYVDGSFINGRIGYGVVVVSDDNMITELSGVCDEPGAEEQRQIPGEIEAVKQLVLWCQNNGIESINVHYDYTGLEKWAKGEWKTNTKITQRYAEFMKNIKTKIIWNKVKSHSGNRWNDHADTLAKMATEQ